MTDQKTLSRMKRLQGMLSAGLWDKWFEGKEFTEDWSSAAYPIWIQALRPLAGRPIKILEIGSFEGRSAIFWLEHFPESRLTCVDHFATTRWRTGQDIEDRFDRNLAGYSGRFDKVKKPSASALSSFVEEGAVFDLIFIDGSHYRDNVLIDGLLCWKLIGSGGIIIFDDYLLDLDRDAADRPKDAIDCFLSLHSDEIKELSRGHQIIVQKR